MAGKRAKRPGEGAWKPVFLKWLKSTGNVRFAADQAAIARSKVYAARETDAAFKADWDECEDFAIAKLEAKAHSLAMRGDRLLLMFLLKSHRPEKYREHYAGPSRDNSREVIVDLVEIPSGDE